MVTNARSALARFLPAGGVLLSVLLFGNYAMGLLRDRIFARTFGASAELDAYNAAFVLPELLLDVLVASGLAAPFIPIFLQLRGEEPARANQFGQTDPDRRRAGDGAWPAVLFVFAPQTTASSPSASPTTRSSELYTSLFRVMLITPIIFAASLSIGDVLLAERRFVTYGLAPLLYNAGIIIGTVAFSDAMGIYGAAIGPVLGALLHLAMRLVGLRRHRVSARPRLESTPAVGEFVRLMLPKMISHPVEPMTFLFFTSVASTMAEGSVRRSASRATISGWRSASSAWHSRWRHFQSLSTAYAAGDRPGFLPACCAATCHHRDPHHRRGHRRCSRSARSRSTSSWAAAPSTREDVADHA